MTTVSRVYNFSSGPAVLPGPGYLTRTGARPGRQEHTSILRRARFGLTQVVDDGACLGCGVAMTPGQILAAGAEDRSDVGRRYRARTGTLAGQPGGSLNKRRGSSRLGRPGATRAAGRGGVPGRREWYADFGRQADRDADGNRAPQAGAQAAISVAQGTPLRPDPPGWLAPVVTRCTYIAHTSIPRKSLSCYKGFI